ncbi:MAG TPA: hypothetical protein DCY86_14295 [Bdellovibrionales bacterium]|nr:hypothetical protein [Bdellovibrionales bacterium]
MLYYNCYIFNPVLDYFCLRFKPIMAASAEFWLMFVEKLVCFFESGFQGYFRRVGLWSGPYSQHACEEADDHHGKPARASPALLIATLLRGHAPASEDDLHGGWIQPYIHLLLYEVQRRIVFQPKGLPRKQIRPPERPHDRNWNVGKTVQ